MTKDEVTRLYIIDEMSKFRCVAEINAFVGSLAEADVQALCRMLSGVWRRNSIYRVVPNFSEWTEELVEIDRIVVGQINAEVNPLLRRHNYRLSEIAKDNAIMQHPEFGTQGKITLDRFIAIRSGNDFELRDGAHRAIRLAQDGQRNFKLIVPAI